MTQFRTFEFEADDSTFALNSRLLEIVQSGLYNGFDPVLNTGLNLTLNHETTGVTTIDENEIETPKKGTYRTKQGVTINEDASIVLPIDVGTAEPRIDLIVAEHVYIQITGGQPAFYSIIKGTPGATPSAPALTNPKRQVVLGELYIPANMSSLDEVGVIYTKSDTPDYGGNDHTAQIAQNASDIAQNATNITYNSLDIFYNSNDIAQNASDIAQNASDIAQNDSDIAQNASDIAQNTSDINSLDNVTLKKASDLSDVNDASTAFDNIKQIATIDSAGVVEEATSSEAQAGTAGKYIDANLFQSYKTFNKLATSVSQSGGNYVIPETHDTFIFTGSPTPGVTMPDPVQHRNRVIVIDGTDSSISINNTGSGGSQVNDFYNGMAGNPGSGNDLEGVLMTFLSDGQKWINISYNAGLACPYIYINGEYFDEILKNQIGVGNYKEEEIEVTLNEGENVIRLSEEKKEITFIDYLILSVDCVDTILFDERKTLRVGDYYDFTVNVPSHKKATLRAKGYYIKD